MDHLRLEDEALMARIRDRDGQAFEALFDRYRDLVYSLSFRILDDQAGAQDVAQDVFVELWRQPRSYDAARGRFLPWLLQVVRHRAIDERRRRERRERREGEVAVDYEAVVMAGKSGDPILAFVLGQDGVEVRQALAELPDGQRRAIELAYFAGLTQREIAVVLHQPVGTVKTRIRSGLRKLRTALAEGDEGE